MDYYLNITEALAARGLAKEIAPYAGETVFQLTWLDREGGRREGFASAQNPKSAVRLLRAHEAGYGRAVTDPTAKKWGSKAQLVAWGLKTED